jgi:hypothetical protein
LVTLGSSRLKSRPISLLREYHLTGEIKMPLCKDCKHYQPSESSLEANDRCGHPEALRTSGGIRTESIIIYTSCETMLQFGCKDHRLWEAK